MICLLLSEDDAFLYAAMNFSKASCCVAVLATAPEIALKVALGVWLVLFVVVQPAIVQTTRTNTMVAMTFFIITR